MRNLKLKRTLGYPVSWGAPTFIANFGHPTVSVQLRKRMAVNANAQAPIADLPTTVPSAPRLERRT